MKDFTAVQWVLIAFFVLMATILVWLDMIVNQRIMRGAVEPSNG